MRALIDILLPPACAGCGRTGSCCATDACVPSVRRSRDDDRFVAADAGIALGDALALGVAAFAYEGPLRGPGRPEVHWRVADRGSAGQRQPPALLGCSRSPARRSSSRSRCIRSGSGPGLQPGRAHRRELASRRGAAMAAPSNAHARRRSSTGSIEPRASRTCVGRSTTTRLARHCGDRRRRHRHDDGHARGVRLGAQRRPAPGRSTASPSPGRSRPECRRAAARRRPACPLGRGARRSSRQSRAPRAHSTSRHGLRLRATFVTRPSPLDEDGVDRVAHEEHVDRRRALDPEALAVGRAPGVRSNPTAPIPCAARDPDAVPDGRPA